MNIKKCDGCEKILTKQDDYFTIDEVSFNKGDSKKNTVRLVLSSVHGDNTYDMTESWCSYTDFHFCPACFDKENLKRFLK